MGERKSDNPKALQIPAQRLLTDLASPRSPEIPSKFTPNFLLRSLFVAIFIALLPLFPGQAPEFVNQTIFTRSWELLHLLLVGIAVSYGVFSRRNVEAEKENVASHSKPDNVHSYVSKILQVSSVFDDEMEAQSGDDDGKVQTWSHQYFRGEPMVVVSEDSSANDVDKPLLLPVRSLKSPVSHPEMVPSVDDNGGFLGSFNEPNSLKKGARIGANFEQHSEESFVHPSPIPWRSRSGRMEVKEDLLGSSSPPLYSHEFELDRFVPPSLHSPVHRQNPPTAPPKKQTSCSSPSPRKLSPSPSLSPDFRGKNGEEPSKKGHYRSPPPPPPPPPPPISRKSHSQAVNSVPKDEMKDHSRSSREDRDLRDSGSQSFRLDMRAKASSDGPSVGRLNSWGSRDSGGDSLGSETKSRHYSEASVQGKSDSSEKRAKISNEGSLNGQSESIRSESRSELHNGVGKSVRTVKTSNGGGTEMNNGKQSRELEAMAGEKTGPTGYERPVRETPRPPRRYPKKEVAEKVSAGSDAASEGENLCSKNSNGDNAASVSTADAGTDENEVDKKADEFIAKFREQIRLQRIESIKRSARQRTNISST